MLTGNGRVAILRTAAAEKPVRELVSQSQTSHEIAASLGCSPAPVKRPLENILRKLAVRNTLGSRPARPC